VHACTVQRLFQPFWPTSPTTQRQGSNFESKLVAELCSIAGINKTRTTPFHRRSDVQTERANRTILQMPRASIDAQPESWPDRLPALLAAYRMTPHSVTGISPNILCTDAHSSGILHTSHLPRAHSFSILNSSHTYTLIEKSASATLYVHTYCYTTAPLGGFGGSTRN